jgi:hypothetical protein
MPSAVFPAASAVPADFPAIFAFFADWAALCFAAFSIHPACFFCICLFFIRSPLKAEPSA